MNKNLIRIVFFKNYDEWELDSVLYAEPNWRELIDILDDNSTAICNDFPLLNPYTQWCIGYFKDGKIVSLDRF